MAIIAMRLQTHNFLGDVVGYSFCPLLTAEAFAEASGLPLGVVEAQLDRRILPVVRLGKRRMVNVEALRLRAIQQASESGDVEFPSLAYLNGPWNRGGSNL